jgi:hypothetical protein
MAWGLVAGVILLDRRVQAGQAANQTRILRSAPGSPEPLEYVYLATYFPGGAMGSALGAYGWSHWRWSGVCVAGTAQLVVAAPVATARETSLA